MADQPANTAAAVEGAAAQSSEPIKAADSQVKTGDSQATATKEQPIDTPLEESQATTEEVADPESVAAEDEPPELDGIEGAVLDLDEEMQRQADEPGAFPDEEEEDLEEEEEEEKEIEDRDDLEELDTEVDPDDSRPLPEEVESQEERAQPLELGSQEALEASIELPGVVAGLTKDVAEVLTKQEADYTVEHTTEAQSPGSWEEEKDDGSLEFANKKTQKFIQEGAAMQSFSRFVDRVIHVRAERGTSHGASAQAQVEIIYRVIEQALKILEGDPEKFLEVLKDAVLMMSANNTFKKATGRELDFTQDLSLQLTPHLGEEEARNYEVGRQSFLTTYDLQPEELFLEVFQTHAAIAASKIDSIKKQQDIGGPEGAVSRDQVSADFLARASAILDSYGESLPSSQLIVEAMLMHESSLGRSGPGEGPSKSSQPTAGMSSRSV